MRRIAFCMAGAMIISAAHAADTLQQGAPPPWVKPVALPPASQADEAPVKVLLADQQVRLQPDEQTIYSETALRIQTAQGLAAGNLSFPWRPDF